MGCPSAREDLAVAVRHGKMVVKNPGVQPGARCVSGQKTFLVFFVLSTNFELYCLMERLLPAQGIAMAHNQQRCPTREQSLLK
jgi:hypothetical protein